MLIARLFLQQVVQKTAATFAPRASTANKNPAVPGTALYTVFEVQGYASMFLGGVLSFNLIFPSNEPDLLRLMGMWSIWMFSKFCSLTNKQNFLFSFFGVERKVPCLEHALEPISRTSLVAKGTFIWFELTQCLIRLDIK